MPHEHRPFAADSEGVLSVRRGQIGCPIMFFTNEGAIAKFVVAVGLGSSSNAERWTRF